jgi:hypothetical protein
LLSFSLWNYNPTNDNTYGDHWNGEDFSIYSPLKDSKDNVDIQTNGKQLVGDSGLITSPEINVQKLKAIDDEITTALDSSQEHWHKGGRVLDAVIVSNIGMVQRRVRHINVNKFCKHI